MDMHDPFGRCKPGLTLNFEREDRIRLLWKWASAVVAGKKPDAGAEMFAASGVLAWLQEGGNLTREFWRTMAPQGCKNSESQVLKMIQGSSSGRQQAQINSGRIEPSNNSEEDQQE